MSLSVPGGENGKTRIEPFAAGGRCGRVFPFSPPGTSIKKSRILRLQVRGREIGLPGAPPVRDVAPRWRFQGALEAARAARWVMGAGSDRGRSGARGGANELHRVDLPAIAQD